MAMQLVLLAFVAADPGAEPLEKEAIEALRRAAASVVHVRLVRGGDGGQGWSGAVVCATRTAEFVATVLPPGSGDPALGVSFEVVRPDSEAVGAEWVGRDDRTGIALLRIPAGGLRPVDPGRGLGLRPGARLYRLTNPLGIRANVDGASARGFELAPPGDTISCMRLKFELPCRLAEAGGILADDRGHAIALICAPPDIAQAERRLAARGGSPQGSEAVGPPETLPDIAIPMEIVVRICDALARNGEVRRGHVGATFGWQAEAEGGGHGAGTTGIVVLDVRPGGPAARAGLLPGDLVTSAGGRPIRTVRDAVAIAERVEFELAGGSLPVEVLRPSPAAASAPGEIRSITIAVEPLPSSSEAPAGSATP